MGAKQSKGGKVKQNGNEPAGAEDGLDTFDKTSTLPATFRAKDDEMTKSGTLPREGVAGLDRNTSFSKRFRKSVSKLVGHKAKQEGCTDSPKTEDGADTKDEKNGDLNKTNENESSVKSPIDHKLAQKIARAKFFQELYSTPTNVPKPPRSRNGFSPHENGISDDDPDNKSNNATPVVKLIEKHQEAIEKHQEEIRNSMGSPDILKGRMDSFRRSRLVENSESHVVEKESITIRESKEESVTESSFNKVETETNQSTQKCSVSEVSSQMTSEVSQVSESSASVVIKEESSTSVTKHEESHAVNEEFSLKSETNNLVQESSTLTEFVSEEKKEEKLESVQLTEEIRSAVQTSQVESEFHIETNSSSEIISQTSGNEKSEEFVAEVLNEESGKNNSGEDNDITNDKPSDSDSAEELDGSEKEE